MPLTADIDGTDITELCQLQRWRPRWNAPDSGIVRYPAHLLTITPGISELHILSGATIVHSGPCWYSELSGDPDKTYGEITSWNHRVDLRTRMCRQGVSDPQPGSMVDLSPVIEGNVTATEIAAAFLQNCIDIDPTFPSGNAPPLTIGTVQTGGVDLSSVPMAFPMTIDRMFNLLISTGQLIVEEVPGVGSTTLNFLNPYENDISGSVAYGYGTGAFNAQVAEFTVDMDDVVNAIWYFIGRRRPDGRWPGSITASAPHIGASWPAALLARIGSSRTSYGYRQEIQILDDAGDEGDIREMFEERWANEAWVRAVPRTFATIKPDRGLMPNFVAGDTIGVAAGSMLGGGFSGAQRVYGFDLSCDFDGIVAFDDITTSADQEGAEAVGA